MSELKCERENGKERGNKGQGHREGSSHLGGSRAPSPGPAFDIVTHAP